MVDLQLDAQNSYLFTYNRFIKILYMFRALPCSSSGGLRRNCDKRTEQKVDYRTCNSYTSRQRQGIDSKEYSKRKKRYIPSL